MPVSAVVNPILEVNRPCRDFPLQRYRRRDLQLLANVLDVASPSPAARACCQVIIPTSTKIAPQAAAAEPHRRAGRTAKVPCLSKLQKRTILFVTLSGGGVQSQGAAAAEPHRGAGRIPGARRLLLLRHWRGDILLGAAGAPVPINATKSPFPIPNHFAESRTGAGLRVNVPWWRSYLPGVSAYCLQT